MLKLYIINSFTTKKLLHLLFALLISIVFPFRHINAQSTTDFQSWYDASLKLNLKKGWEVTTQYRVRFYNNSSEYRGSYFFLTGEKKINKHINLLANYRLALVEDQAYHRFAFGLHAKYKIQNWTLFFRPTFQNQRQYFLGDDENGGNGKTFLRTRIGAKYHINKRFETYLYAEPFFNIEKNGLPVNFWQNAAGLTANLTKRNSLTAYYVWQPETKVKNPQTKHIAGLSLGFELKPSNKHKTKAKKQDNIPQF